MRIYRINGLAEEKSICCGKMVLKEKALGFVRTEGQARNAVKLIALEGVQDVYFEPEDIPAGKEGFVDWLNDFVIDDYQQIIKSLYKE